MTQTAEDFVKEYGDQSYHKAVSFSSMATMFGDDNYAKQMSDVAIELIQAGYHKHPKEKSLNP